MTTLQELRQKYPQYSDMSDEDFAGAFHRKFYSDMPRDDFNKRLGIDVPTKHQAYGNDAKGWLDYGLDTLETGVKEGALLGYGDEVLAGLSTGFGYLGDYDKALAKERGYTERLRRNAPGTSLAATLGGGLAIPFGALGLAGKAATTGQAMRQGAMIGGGIGAVAGFGSGEGGFENRLSRAADGGIAGTIFGAAAPPVINAVGAGIGKVADATRTARARMEPTMANIRQRFGPTPKQPRTLSAAASADTGAPMAPTAADAAGEQVIANRLAQANVSEADLRQRLATIRENQRMYSKSHAVDATTLADLDPSMAKLAGSVARQQPEAYNIADTFLSTRQTGSPPKIPLHPGAGLSVRTRMGGDNEVAGQYERVKDGLRRALVIEDAGAHGHAATGYATEKGIIQRARDAADPLYKAAYQAGEGVDLSRQVRGVLQEASENLIDQPDDVARVMERMIQSFNRAVSPGGKKSHIERLDNVKKYWDSEIEKLFKGSDSRNTYLGGRLTDLKNKVIAALDDDSLGDLAEKYRIARNDYSSQMELRDAYRLGRDVFKADSEVAVDQFRQLATEGERKLARLGFYQGYSDAMARRARTDDVTKVFEQPRMQEILGELVPRYTPGQQTPGFAGNAKASRTNEFYNRPERLEGFIGNERNYLATRNRALGGSQTAERMQEDEAVKGIIGFLDNMRSSPTASGLAIRMAEKALHKMFGFRQDTAAAVARKLLTADPAERDSILLAVANRLGPTRTEHLLRLLRENQMRAAQGGGLTAGTARGEE